MSSSEVLSDGAELLGYPLIANHALMRCYIAAEHFYPKITFAEDGGWNWSVRFLTRPHCSAGRGAARAVTVDPFLYVSAGGGVDAALVLVSSDSGVCSQLDGGFGHLIEVRNIHHAAESVERVSVEYCGTEAKPRLRFEGWSTAKLYNPTCEYFFEVAGPQEPEFYKFRNIQMRFWR